MIAYFSRFLLFLTVGIHALASIFGCVGNPTPSFNRGEPEGHQLQAHSQIEKAFNMAKTCSLVRSDCSLVELEHQLKGLTDSEVGQIADKKDGEYNLSHLLLKARVEDKTVEILKQFLARLDSIDSQKSMAQLDKKVENNTKSLVTVMADTDNRPGGERTADREDILALLVSRNPMLVNDMSMAGRFNNSLFSDVMRKIEDSKLSVVVEQLNPGNLNSFVMWAKKTSNRAKGRPLFKRLYNNAATPAKRTVLFNELWSAAQDSYEPDLKDLIRDMSPGGANEWGVASEFVTKLDAIVTEQYANRGLSGKADFKNLYSLAALGIPEKSTIRLRLKHLILSDPTGYAAVKDFTDNDLIASDSYGIRDGVGDFLADLVAEQYANKATSGKADYKALYAWFAPNTFEQKNMLNKLGSIVVAEGYAGVKSFVQLDVVGADNYGVKASLDKPIIDALVQELYKGFAQGQADARPTYTALYDSLPTNGMQKKYMRNAVVKAAYTSGSVTHVQAAVDKVAALVNADFFSANTIKRKNGDAGGAFDPFDVGQDTTLLYAVLAKAKADAGLLTHALINNSGNPGGLAAAIKSKGSFALLSFAGLLSWQDYLDQAINLNPPHQQKTLTDLVQPDAHTQVVARAVLLW